METRKGSVEIFVGFLLVGIVVVGIVLYMAFMPQYRIYKQDLRGQATLREQTWTKKVAIEQARAKKESAILEAEAEVERAKGIAEANRIIGDSLNGNEAYLRYRMIETMADQQTQLIYVPTEAGLPLLEAKR